MTRASTSPAFTRALWSLAVAVPAAGVAMLLYPGGNHAHPDLQRYSLTHNFFSDLGMTTALNGAPNRIGAALFVVALGALLIGFGGALIAFVRLYASAAPARRFAQLAMAAGALTVLAFAGVAATPEDRSMSAHIAFTVAAFRIFPFASLFLAIAAAVSGWPRRIIVAWSLLTIALVAYESTFFLGSVTRTEGTLVFHVLAQKAIAVIAVSSLSYLCFETSRSPR